MHAHILPHPATFAMAAAFIAGGAPLFSSGLRALRLRRELARARAAADPSAPGYVALEGRVALETPLFSPLTGRPCAGFRLEVRGIGAEVANEIVVARGFSIAHAGAVAHVDAERGTWQLGVTAERTLEAAAPMTSGLEALLSSAPEALWWRRAGGRLQLVERALFADATVHVVGHAATTRVVHETESIGLATGTDDVAESWTTEIETEETVIGPSSLDYLMISDAAPAAPPAAVAWYRTLGVVAGPLLTLVGLWLLMNATDQLRSFGRFQ